MDKEYRKQIEQIKIDAEKYTNNQMKPVYTGQKVALDKLHTLIGKLYINYATDGLLKMSSTQKANVDIKTLLKKMAVKLNDTEVKKVTSIISSIYEDTYYKSVYIMGEGMKLKPKFNILKKEFIDSATNTKFKGEMFSDRIWTNKIDMMDKLQSGLVDCMNGKTTIDKIAKNIKDIFNVSAYESQRLVHTENARVQTQASHDIGVSMGVEKVMWSSTLDMKTAEEDGELDGKIWGINEDHPEPPLHPNCRCCLIDVPYSDWKPTLRRDNLTGEDIDYTNYVDWKKNNV